MNSLMRKCGNIERLKSTQGELSLPSEKPFFIMDNQEELNGRFTKWNARK